MLQVLVFMLKCVADFIKMLFTIDIGMGSIGEAMLLCFVLLPIITKIVGILKYESLETSYADFHEKQKFKRKEKERSNSKHSETGRHEKTYFERRRDN